MWNMSKLFHLQIFEYPKGWSGFFKHLSISPRYIIEFHLFSVRYLALTHFADLLFRLPFHWLHSSSICIEIGSNHAKQFVHDFGSGSLEKKSWRNLGGQLVNALQIKVASITNISKLKLIFDIMNNGKSCSKKFEFL